MPRVPDEEVAQHKAELVKQTLHLLWHDATHCDYLNPGDRCTCSTIDNLLVTIEKYVAPSTDVTEAWFDYVAAILLNRAYDKVEGAHRG